MDEVHEESEKDRKREAKLMAELERVKPMMVTFPLIHSNTHTQLKHTISRNQFVDDVWRRTCATYSS